MNRCWFFTWRTYGTWLPGDDGFVGYYHLSDGRRVIDNGPGEPTTEAIPRLARYARKVMSGEPVALSVGQAEALLAQFQETAACRGWIIGAIAILVNHVHIVFQVPGDPDPSHMLRDWKSYASRALNRTARSGEPAASAAGCKAPGLPSPRSRPVWWADGGSKRPVKTAERRLDAICYVRDQENPLIIWLSPEAQALLVACGEL